MYTHAHRPGPPVTRPRTATGVVVGTAILGVAALALGPGSCALSCFTASDKVDAILGACKDGESEACRETTGSLYFAEQFGRQLPRIVTECGSFDGFDQQGIRVDVDAPYRWTVEVTGRFQLGTCGAGTPMTFRLVGLPWRWKLDDFGPART